MPEAVQALMDALHRSFSSVGHELICVFVIGNIEILFFIIIFFLPQNCVTKQNLLEIFNSLEFEELSDLQEHEKKIIKKYIYESFWEYFLYVYYVFFDLGVLRLFWGPELLKSPVIMMALKLLMKLNSHFKYQNNDTPIHKIVQHAGV